jgi:hypothetical protein
LAVSALQLSFATMSFKFGVLLFLATAPLFLWAQFAPQAGVLGTTAIAADSNVFVNWASGYALNRSWQNIADTSLGKVTTGEEWSITGKAGNGVISLGDGGSITLTFPYPIRNGQGPDFAVFENGFKVNDSLAFLELAFVEVSTNGQRFVRFPASYIGSNIQLDAFTGADARNYHNLAGKYVFNFGTPFNLDELKDSTGIDINNINFVRIIDVKGAVSELGSKDINGNYINDPWPTPFPSAGFDFDAVGVINQNNNGMALQETNQTEFAVFPNPGRLGLPVSFSGFGLNQIKIHKSNGETFDDFQHQSEQLIFNQSGLYIIEVSSSCEKSKFFLKLIVTP